MSPEGINALAECRISTENLLKMLNSHEIDEILNKRELLSEKIKFRYNLNKWREQNDCELVACCANDCTLSMVLSWISSGTLVSSLSKPDSIIAISSSEFDLETIFKDTVSGEELLEKGNYLVVTKLLVIY
ncbi:uncharacterized protein LOC129941547 [Eupeodes corollae]|uniref:uncharacterized protein LOC129941547 n=1 Tax=Eupeodes corollae TaxID=290404 RepID=UPI0024930D01|nr:uncharacterized protein LOC129941547 [Eupeodes corollae]